MSEKLTKSITLKCTEEEKCDLEVIAKSEHKTLSEHMRGLGIANIAEIRQRLNHLASLMHMTTDTVNTRFDLKSQPCANGQAQQKFNGCDQLSLIAVASDQ